MFEGGCEPPRREEQGRERGLALWLAGDVAFACSKFIMNWAASRWRAPNTWILLLTVTRVAIPGLCPCAHPKFSSLSVIESEDRTIWVGSGSKIRIRSFRIENPYAPRVHGPELDLQP